MKQFFLLKSSQFNREFNFVGFCKLSCLIVTLFTSVCLNAQTFPTTCTSGDLELVSATLPPNAGESACSCSGFRALRLTIKNKTGSERTSFAFWGTLVRIGPDGETLSSTPISGCKGPIAKNTSPNPFTLTTIVLDKPEQLIEMQCNQTLKIVNLYLAWTSSNNNETCPVLTASPSTINPKCGRLPEIQILSGVDAEFTTVSATCSGGTSSITTRPFGGLAPYRYAWTTIGGTIPPGQEDDKDLIGLTPGIYTLLITDANECTATKSRIITNPSALALGTCTATAVSCFGGANGTVTAGDVTNAVGTVSYLWKRGTTTVGTNANLTGLIAGTYTLTIQDNCSSKTCEVVVGSPSAALSSTKTQVNVMCFGAATGSINLSPSGGTAPYTYAWTASNGGVVPPGQEDDQDISGLKKGTYDVVVTDANGNTGGCRTTNSVIITEPAAALALGTCSKTDVTCFGGSNGKVTAGTVSNAVGTVNYLWKRGSTTVGSIAEVTGLTAGEYTLTVSDDCSTQNCTVTIGGPSAALSMGDCSKTNVTCYNGTNGSVTAGAVSNSIGTVNYVWKRGATTVGSSASVDNLPVGNYDLTVTDNCSSKTCSVTITGPTAALSLGTCSKTNATCTAGGSLTAGTVTNSIGTIHYSWKNAADVVVGTAASVTNQPAGVYTLTVTDDCSSQNCSVTIGGASEIAAPSVCIVQPSLCGSAGSVTITSPAAGANVSFSIDNGTTWQPGTVFNNLGAGSVTGIKVKIGDCVSPAASCSNSNCNNLRTTNPTENQIVLEELFVKPSAVSQTEEKASVDISETINIVLASKSNVFAAPNPFVDRVKFTVQSSISGRGSLDLYNMMGQKVKTVFEGFIEAGKTKYVEYQVPATLRSSLMYVFSIGEQKVSGKLIGIK